VLWQPFQPTPCRPLNPIRLHWQAHRELIDPPQRCIAQFAAEPDQVEPDQENHELAQPNAFDRSNSAPTSQAPQSVGMPSPRVAARQVPVTTRG
jgi:hypothetical protein